MQINDEHKSQLLFVRQRDQPHSQQQESTAPQSNFYIVSNIARAIIVEEERPFVIVQPTTSPLPQPVTRTDACSKTHTRIPTKKGAQV